MIRHRRLTLDGALTVHLNVTGASPGDNAQVLALLNQILAKETATMAGIAELQAEVERNGQVDQSAIVLLQGLAAKIEELKNNPVELQAFVDQLKGSSDALAAAVVANTPAEPPTP